MPSGGFKIHSDDKWIQRVFDGGSIKAGGLHESFGQKIPTTMLTINPGDSPKVKKQKTLAKTLRGMNKGGGNGMGGM
jgi:hypothetical protein